jgi:curved DNA-binding protein CbpA
MVMVRNHYLLLGIPPDASQRQIKSVYRNLAKRFHPDRNKGSEAAAELFRQVNDAYRVLSDPKRRTRYDQQLKQQQEKDAAASTSSRDKDPQQKFSRFLGSLLDALFGSTNQPTSSTTPPRRTVTTPSQTVKRPDFNFYYHLASEKKAPEYSRGNDGVYRRANKRKNTSTQNKYRS